MAWKYSTSGEGLTFTMPNGDRGYKIRYINGEVVVRSYPSKKLVPLDMFMDALNSQPTEEELAAAKAKLAEELAAAKADEENEDEDNN